MAMIPARSQEDTPRPQTPHYCWHPRAPQTVTQAGLSLWLCRCVAVQFGEGSPGGWSGVRPGSPEVYWTLG